MYGLPEATTEFVADSFKGPQLNPNGKLGQKLMDWSEIKFLHEQFKNGKAVQPLWVMEYKSAIATVTQPHKEDTVGQTN